MLGRDCLGSVIGLGLANRAEYCRSSSTLFGTYPNRRASSILSLLRCISSSLCPLHSSMAPLSVLPTGLVASALGVLSHHAYFKRGEHHLDGIRILRVALLLPAVSFLLLFNFGHFTILEAARFLTIVFWSSWVHYGRACWSIVPSSIACTDILVHL